MEHFKQQYVPFQWLNNILNVTQKKHFLNAQQKFITFNLTHNYYRYFLIMKFYL